MTLRAPLVATLAAASVLALAAPAFADCAQDLKAFDGKLAGIGPQEESAAAAPVKTTAGESTEAAELQALDKETRSEVTDLLDEARAAIETNDEAGCMARVRVARKLISGK